MQIADFHGIKILERMVVMTTLGDLEDSLRSIDSSGPFLRGFSALFGEVGEEAYHDLEIVLASRFQSDDALEPV